jgi:hypothetical protein
MKQAEAAFDAAQDRFAAAERVLDVVREEPAQARRERYAARQGYGRATSPQNASPGGRVTSPSA